MAITTVLPEPVAIFEQIRGKDPPSPERMVLQTLEDDVISEARAAELLGKSLAELGEEVAVKHNGLPLSMHNRYQYLGWSLARLRQWERSGRE